MGRANGFVNRKISRLAARAMAWLNEKEKKEKKKKKGGKEKKL